MFVGRVGLVGEFIFKFFNLISFFVPYTRVYINNCSSCRIMCLNFKVFITLKSQYDLSISILLNHKKKFIFLVS